LQYTQPEDRGDGRIKLGQILGRHAKN